MNQGPGNAATEASPSTRGKARYVMIGGFLGAGKTTALLKLAEWATRRGHRVGLISNDQGRGLVDTALFASRRFAVAEIPGGCFCCRFNSLIEAARQLTQATRPDLFLAEPVGSCTDLVATVSYPLRQIYGADYTLAPLSVVVDPVRAARVLGLESGAKFSDQVRYIYRKQLEEADWLVMNKCDLLTPARRERLRAALAMAFPQARLLEVSARSGEGLDAWFRQALSTEQQPRAVMQVDYQIYADGEALLGWLNGTAQLSSADPFDANGLLRRLAQEIQHRLQTAGAEIAHLKMTLDPHSAFGDLAVVNLVGNDFVPELSWSLVEPVERGELTVNLRAEADPEILRKVVEHAVKQVTSTTVSVQWPALEAFKPGKPRPTHRVESA